MFFLILSRFFFLADEKAEDDENHTYPLAEREMFAEEKEHPESRKSRAYIIERIRLRDTYLAQRSAE